jgi:hypothetical protein
VRTQAENQASATDEPVDVVVSFTSRSGPFAGTVGGVSSGSPRKFHGWLELMDAVESLRAGDEDEASR